MIKIYLSLVAKNPYKITRFLAIGIIVVAENIRKEMAFPLYDSSNSLARIQSLRLAMLSVKGNAHKEISIFLSNDKYLKYLITINNRYVNESSKHNEVIKRVRELYDKLNPSFYVTKSDAEIVTAKELARLCTSSTKMIDRTICQ